MRPKIESYIEEWKKRGYSNDIPDIVPDRLMQLNKAPSYKAICVAILKNDYCLKTLGFQPKKSKYYDVLKKIELAERYRDQPKQLCFSFIN